MRRPVLIAVCVLVAASGCGGEDEPAAPLRGIQLELTAPADAATVSDERVAVRGRVTPVRSEVFVAGRPVRVEGGTFAAEVELDEGANIVDVAASHAGRRAASTAVRVVREVPVEVPDLEGEEADPAIRTLEALGLEVERTDGGGLLDDLRGGEDAVCETDPPPGTEVRPGSTVEVVVARACLGRGQTP